MYPLHESVNDKKSHFRFSFPESRVYGIHGLRSIEHNRRKAMKSLKSTSSGYLIKQIMATLVLVTAAGSMVSANAATADANCTIFAPDQIYPGQNFDLRVSRVPGYPGGWFAPTFYIEVSYPTEPGWVYNQGEQRTIPKMGVIRADFTLQAPYSIYPDSQGGFVPGGTVKIVAKVVEGSKGKAAKTLCTATSTIGM
jgi:hypothetical protein